MRKQELSVHCTYASLSLTLLVSACQPAAEGGEVGAKRLALHDSDCGSTITWGQCEDEQLEMLGAKCGLLSVPLDHKQPDAEHIQLAVSKLAASGPAEEYQGVLVLNPGGPGIPGLTMPSLSTLIRADAARAYDWVGFDPRGVGASLPKLNCRTEPTSAPRPPYVPDTPEIEQAWLTRVEAFAHECEENAGNLLEHMHTEDVARDLDLLREALGTPKLNFWGLSYGTRLGQIYATLYPERVRRMVFDSSMDPAGSPYEWYVDADAASIYENNIRAWWDWIAQHDDIYHLGATREQIAQAFDADQQQLQEHPAGGVVGPSEWQDIFFSVGAAQNTWWAPNQWARYAGVWKAWRETGDPALLVAEYESVDSPGDDNGFAVSSAVLCTDDVWPADWPRYRDDVWDVFEKAPLYAWWNAWYTGPCLFWPVKGKPAREIVGRHVPPILLVSETKDGSTPFEWSHSARSRFPNSSLIATVGGRSHAAAMSGNACVDDAVADYLVSGALPARKAGDGPDKRCDPLPAPEPGDELPAEYAPVEHSMARAPTR